MRGVVFVDRDGVINEKAAEGEYVESWEEFRFLPGALAALAALTRAGATVIVITNQRGVARGRISRETLDTIHARMTAAVQAAGGSIDAVYVCPHERGTCECRKPGLGMFVQAREDRPWIDFGESVVIGDALSDLEPANRIGARSLLVADDERRAGIAGAAQARGIRIDGVATSLLELVAARLIIGSSSLGGVA